MTLTVWVLLLFPIAACANYSLILVRSEGYDPRGWRCGSGQHHLEPTRFSFSVRQDGWFSPVQPIGLIGPLHTHYSPTPHHGIFLKFQILRHALYFKLYGP